MVPITIVTKDRAEYLDITLRSLSGTRLPADVPVRVVDDASGKPTTAGYYETANLIQTTVEWPKTNIWYARGLGIVNQAHASGYMRGIGGRVRVTRYTKNLGVVQRSVATIRSLFRTYDAPAVIMLQDDVLFKEDWYETLTTLLHYDYGQPLGVLAGCKLNHRLKNPHNYPVLPSGITAQCLLITRPFFEAAATFFQTPPQVRTRFDDLLRQAAAHHGFWAGVTYPFICQHIGIQSLVRPNRSWNSVRSGRIGYYVDPPYAMAKEVRQFV